MKLYTFGRLVCNNRTFWGQKAVIEGKKSVQLFGSCYLNNKSVPGDMGAVGTHPQVRHDKTCHGH